MKKIISTLVVVLAVVLSATAQIRTITGVVTNDKGQPIAGASVTTNDGKNGTQTDNNGKYSIKVGANAKSLVFSDINYNTNTQLITGNVVNVTLTVKNSDLDEVVVVAYGTQKKEAITGSQATVQDLDKRNISNVSQAIAGAAPGISTTSGNGQPGSSAAIRIRGFGSVNASASPLYVLDGFPYGGYIGDINANDIESITLLKDASSTALYGSRAANGVVMITTKKGKSLAPKITVYGNSGLSTKGIDEYERVGTTDYYPVMWQGLKNGLMFPKTGTGQTEAVAALNATNGIATQLVYNPFNVPNNQVVGTDGKLNPNASLLYNDFDWYSPIERQGGRSEVGFNVASRNNKSDYYFSLSYLNDQGFVIRSDFERVNARIAMNTQLRSWLKTGVNVTTAIVSSNQAAGDGNNNFINPFVFARGMGPIYPVRAFDRTTGAPIFGTDGTQLYDYGQYAGSVNRPSGASPGRHILYETLLNENMQTRNSSVGRAYIETQFLKFFTFTTNVGIDLNNYRLKSFQNRIVGDGVTSKGTASLDANEYRTVSLNQLLNYKREFGKSELSVLVGHESQKNKDSYSSVLKRGQIFEGNIELANFVTLGDITGDLRELRREGVFSRFNYGYNNRYFLDLSYRRDASSRFSPKSRWGDFYSAGVSWSLIQEDMFKNLNWLDNLKLRASFGTVGNDGLDTYFEYQALYALGWNNATEPGVIATKLASPDLTWEVNKTFNVGLDFAVVKNRISGTIEYFDRGSSQLLFDVPQGLSSIITSTTRNIGSMSNKGIEAQLGFDIVRTKDFNWDLELNFTTLKNKISKLPAETPQITSGTKRLEVGRDLYAFYLRRWAGVDPADGAALYYANPGTTGATVRVNAKGDSLTTNPTNAEYGYSGTAIPKFFGSVNNTFTYKGFSLFALLNYQVGGKFYDGNYAGLMSFRYGSSIHTDVLNAWKKPGDITNVPRIDDVNTGDLNAASDRWLIDASYLSVRNVTLSYTLPKASIAKLGLDQARVFVGGENLYVFSKRTGLNPAESFNGTNSPVYTPNRLVNAGFNISF